MLGLVGSLRSIGADYHNEVINRYLRYFIHNNMSSSEIAYFVNLIVISFDSWIFKFHTRQHCDVARPPIDLKCV